MLLNAFVPAVFENVLYIFVWGAVHSEVRGQLIGVSSAVWLSGIEL